MRWFAHLSMWRRQAFPHVDPKQCVLAQGDVEFEEVWLAQVKQRPPKDAWRNILTDTLTQLQLPAVYTAVLQHPRPWDRRQEKKQELFDKKSISKAGRKGNILSSVWKYLQYVQRKINIYYSVETQICANECVVRAAKVINPKSHPVFSLEIIIPLYDSNGHTRTLPFPLHLLILSSREKTVAMLTAQIDCSNSNQKITQQTGLDGIRSNIHTQAHFLCLMGQCNMSGLGVSCQSSRRSQCLMCPDKQRQSVSLPAKTSGCI